MDGVVIDAGKGGAAAAQTEFEQDAKQLGNSGVQGDRHSIRGGGFSPC